MTAELPDWVVNIPPNEGVHTAPPPVNRWDSLSENQIKELRKRLLESVISVVTQALTGLFMPGPPGSAFDQLKAWADGLAEGFGGLAEGLQKMVDDLLVALGLPPGGLPSDVINGIVGTINDVNDELQALIDDIAGRVDAVWDALSTVDFSHGPIVFIQSLANALINAGTALLSSGSPLNALNLFNLIPTDLMAHIPASNIGTYVTNMVTDPNFLDPGSFSGQSIWFQRPQAGHGGTGAAYTTANGTSKELLGNLIAVSKDQVINFSAKAKWTGLTGTGTPIQLAVTGYTDTGASTQYVIYSHNVTPPTTDWIDFFGTWTVPANVVSIRTRLVVAATATAGQVWFSKISATKVGAMIQRLIAGTDAGTLLPDDITNLFSGIITNAMELLNKAGLTDFNDLLSTIGGSFGNTIADVEDRLNDFLHSLSPLNADHINTGQVGDQYVPGLGSIHDVLVTAVGSLSGYGFDIPKVEEVLHGQTNSLVTISTLTSILHGKIATVESKLAALPVSLGGTGVGISYGGIVGATDTDDFERVSSTSLGAEWLQFYSAGGGQWATPNGHDAEYLWSGTSDREFVCVRNKISLPRSLTDYQRVTQVLSSKATRHNDALLGTFNYVGHNDVWLRVSDNTTSLANITGVRIRFGGDGSISIVRFVNGIATTLKSYPTGTYTPPGPGSALIGEAGDIDGGDGGRRYFRGIFGNSILIEVTETGTASGFGPAFRRWGHGGRVEGWTGLFDNGQERPGTLHHWQGMDQVFT